jgi:hypothetical protein
MTKQIVPSEQPTLHELLDEPMVRLLMAKDGVSRSQVEALFRRLHRTKARAAVEADGSRR